MTSINRSRRLGRGGFIQPSAAGEEAQRHRRISFDPEIIVDGKRLNKCLDSLEGLSGQ